MMLRKSQDVVACQSVQQYVVSQPHKCQPHAGTRGKVRGSTRVFRIHLLVNMNVCIKFQGNPSRIRHEARSAIFDKYCTPWSHYFIKSEHTDMEHICIQYDLQSLKMSLSLVYTVKKHTQIYLEIIENKMLLVTAELT